MAKRRESKKQREARLARDRAIRAKVAKERARAKRRIARKLAADTEDLLKRQSVMAERMRLLEAENDELQRWRRALNDLNKYRLQHRDGGKALHKSIIRHLPENEFMPLRQKLFEAIWTERESPVFYDAAYEFGVPVGEVYTLFWSP